MKKKQEVPVISIIIPVYNGEKYIHRCINSILYQSFSQWELILVDDGSRDESGKICDNIAAQDDRIRVIHQENQGVSQARNTGIACAEGEFIMFVDSDDYIDRNMLEIMMAYKDPSTDMIISSITMITKTEQNTYSIEEKEYTAKQILEDYCMNKFPAICLSSPCAKLYRRAVVQELGLAFPENMNLGEDFVFNMRYLLCNPSIKITDKTNYYYMRDNEESLFSKFRINWYYDSKKVFEEQYQTAKKMNCSREALICAETNYKNSFVGHIIQAVRTADKQTCINYFKCISQDQWFCKSSKTYKSNIIKYLLVRQIQKGRFHIAYAILKLKYNPYKQGTSGGKNG